MVSCSTQFIKILRMVDFFQSSKLLRYNGDAEYKSTSGGIVSVTVVIIFIILFSNMGLKTLRKETITSSSYTENEIDPSEMNMVMGPEGGMMFGVYIKQANLTAIPKLFDVKLEEVSYNYGSVVNITTIPLGPCTSAHISFD